MPTKTTPKPNAKATAKLAPGEKQRAAKARLAKAATPKATPKPKAKPVDAATALKALPAAISDEWSRKAVAANAGKQVKPASNRVSGATIALLDNRAEQVAKGDDAPSWYVACITHGVLVPAPSRRHAKHWRALSSVWCPECKKASVAQRARDKRAADAKPKAPVAK
jgi:hypothetical protein